MDDPSVDSYTLGLLRDPNMAGKKLGEEVLELAMAVTTDEEGETQASEEEIADILYASLVFARSRGREVRLGNVLGILVGRNERKTAEEEMGSFPEFSQES
jgi:phosphoribosyl-ATP pyrophosphohydrolase